MSKNMKYSEVRQIIYDRYNGKCAICGKQIALCEMCISLIVPKSKGGYKDFANMQCACECCAVMKNNLTNDEFFGKLYKIIEYITTKEIGRNNENCFIPEFVNGYYAGQEALKEKIYSRFIKDGKVGEVHGN